MIAGLLWGVVGWLCISLPCLAALLWAAWTTPIQAADVSEAPDEAPGACDEQADPRCPWEPEGAPEHQRNAHADHQQGEQHHAAAQIAA